LEAASYRLEPLDRVAYTVAEVAQLLGLSRDRVYELVRCNRIPSKRLGRRIVIPRKPFERWLEAADEWEAY
jgi:excisionase family DNA binding protein